MVYDHNGIDQALEQDGGLGLEFYGLSLHNALSSVRNNEREREFHLALMVGCNRELVEVFFYNVRTSVLTPK